MKGIRPLTNKEYELTLQEAFAKVFTLIEPGLALFTSRIESRTVLYPITPELKPAEFQALMKAATAVGDDTLCLSLLLRESAPDVVEHWMIRLDNVDNYYSLKARNKVLRNALYSPAGEWGVMITEDFYAIAGGSHVFVEALIDNLPISADRQLQDFISAYKLELAPNHPSGPWLRSLLENLYGEARSQQLLTDAGILT